MITMLKSWTKGLSVGVGVALALSAFEPARAVSSESGPERPTLAIRAQRVHVGNGQVLEGATVILAGGRIASVEEAGSKLPQDLPLIEHDGDLSAGMIALQDYSGAAGENSDDTRALLPEADLAHAYQPSHSDFERLVREGITSVVLAPDEDALVGGLTAVVKTHGERVLKRRAQLELSLAARALHYDRYPTSYSGALEELAAQLAQGRGAYGEAKKGRLPVVIRANDKHELQRAAAFAKQHGLRGAIAGGSRSGELAATLVDAGLAVIYRPFSAGMETRSLRSVAKLAEAGVAFGFALEAPLRHPASLRLGAAACVREGLAADAAWRALTLDAARIAGVDGAVGLVAAGKDADLVLWSGPPMDLGSRVEAVYVDGVRAHGGDE